MTENKEPSHIWFRQCIILHKQKNRLARIITALVVFSVYQGSRELLLHLQNSGDLNDFIAEHPLGRYIVDKPVRGRQKTVVCDCKLVYLLSILILIFIFLMNEIRHAMDVLYVN